MLVFSIASLHIASYILSSQNPVFPHSSVSQADMVDKTVVVATYVPRDLRFFRYWATVFRRTAVTGLHVIPEP